MSLFDATGIMVEPWAAAGYDCWIVDIIHPPGVGGGGEIEKVKNRAGANGAEGTIRRVRWDLTVQWLPPFDRSAIALAAAFPPCDHLATSGSRWFKGKGLRALAEGIGLFATATEFCEWSGAPYMIENPVSTISSYWRRPDYVFHPYYFTGYASEDNYVKQTYLWIGGGFKPPLEYRAATTPPDERIVSAPQTAVRQRFRSATPRGFARAVFEANSSAFASNALENRRGPTSGTPSQF